MSQSVTVSELLKVLATLSGDSQVSACEGAIKFSKKIGQGELITTLNVRAGDDELPEVRKPIVECSWCIEDIQAKRPSMSVEDARKFLEDHDDQLQLHMIGAGHDYIDEHLAVADENDTCCDECGADIGNGDEHGSGCSLNPANEVVLPTCRHCGCETLSKDCGVCPACLDKYESK